MRKKARLAALQARVCELREEGLALQGALEDCQTANLLMWLAMSDSGSSDHASDEEERSSSRNSATDAGGASRGGAGRGIKRAHSSSSGPGGEPYLSPSSSVIVRLLRATGCF